ncbi:Arc family DNA-binding protein [Paracoccus saliphilus]|uniref:Arc family DNA-binding protein n=1 Tax=Paracoccus saliphilus TaxID=405559 RepID=A0AA45W2A2_9RHOB|nr:Arc family DNA-binding protein [Paracoccus saliphilus]WCR01911.1 Arc family DNA-binding protein [Paracoccus saliphilus]SIS65072.1 CopG-like RHH_1 or ribbon-helix-helix domain-containing protein, RHH_5 [Paracoccus saliphilus]
MAKTAALGFRIPEEMKEALERAAAADDRSVSSLVTIVLRDWLKEHGYQDGT